MSEIDEKLSLEEMTKPREASGDPEYLAWAEQKIRASVAADKANPGRRASLDTVMKKHGVS